jgi:hypothetical protein
VPRRPVGMSRVVANDRDVSRYACLWCHVCGHGANLPRYRSRTPARVPRKASGAPGRGAAAQHVMPGYQACTFSVSQGDRPLPGGLTWPDTPPAAGRAWVPGCRARTLRRPYHRSTTKSPALKDPPRNRFVISISSGNHMPLTSGSPDRHLRRTPVRASRGKKKAAPAGGESGRRAHGPALGGEAGSVRL